MTACHFCEKLNSLGELSNDELVWQFPHSFVLLGNWQYYQGYAMLVARTHATELFHLSVSTRHAYFDEMCLLARAQAECFHPRKLNYELLGNQVAHLHWHLFPRYDTDPQVLNPVWSSLERAENSEAEKNRLMTGSLSRREIAGLLRQRLYTLTSTIS